jgi:hypothetical protein
VIDLHADVAMSTPDTPGVVASPIVEAAVYLTLVSEVAAHSNEPLPISPLSGPSRGS